MSSIVLELQREAMDGSTDISNLLRKAMVVATKLRRTDLTAWCRAELNGYHDGDEALLYRVLMGKLKVFNPYNGIWMQIQGGGGAVKSLCELPVAEIKHLCEGDGMIMHRASPQIARQVGNAVTPPQVILQRTALLGILDAVRNGILEWTLKLEEDGVLGEGMTFNAEEKRTAMNNGPTYNIGGDFHGVLGNVTSQTAQIGSFNQLEPKLKEAQISESERAALGDLMAALPHAAPAERRNIIEKGLSWVVRNGPALGTLSESIRVWFEQTPHK